MIEPALLRPLIDGLIAFTVLEMLLLAAWCRRSGRGPAWREIGANLFAGLALMAALRCALTPGAGVALLACLAAAGLAHALDLRRRWGARSGD